ncbi:MAG: 50S ribosomal protein L17 [Bacteroidia bacterium]
MRHGKKFNHLGRKSAHRKAMLSNMASSLILHKRITTTIAKAKALRKYVEPLITKSKTDSTQNRRVVFSYLQNKESVKELFGPISNAVADRPGGYTRILKIGPRKGDNAEMAIIELVDFNELAPGKATSTKGSTSRRRRRGKKASGDAAPKATVADKVEEVVEDVVDAVEEVVEDAKEAVVETVEKVKEVVEDVVEDVTEATEEVAEEVEAAVETPAEPVVADKLTKVEGIGPKISGLLIDAGITTFAALAETEVERIKEILAAAGSRYKSHDPSTWPKQAELAAAGKWDELKTWQDELDGGR